MVAPPWVDVVHHLPAPPHLLSPHAGKTVLLELAILRLLSQHITGTGQFAHKPGHLKAVYLAPARALVQASSGNAFLPSSASVGVCLPLLVGCYHSCS